MVLVEIFKTRLQELKEDGWNALFEKTCAFCTKYYIDIPDIKSALAVQGREKRRVGRITHLHHFKVEIFYAVIDSQLQELNNRFNNVNSKLLSCMACLHLGQSFSAFNNRKLVEFASFYPLEFDAGDLVMLEDQLDNYIRDIRASHDFANLQGISELAQKLVEKGKHLAYPMVYLIVKPSLVLPVATATVERAFSAMKIIKTTLRNRMGENWMNDCTVTYIEKDVFDTIENKVIMKKFQEIGTRKIIL